MDAGAVGAVAGLGMLCLVGVVVCLYDSCIDRPRAPFFPSTIVQSTGNFASSFRMDGSETRSPRIVSAKEQ